MAGASTASSARWPASLKTLTNTPNLTSKVDLSMITDPPGGATPAGGGQNLPKGAQAVDPDVLDATLQHIEDEAIWPTDFRAWLALFGGFLLMFNSWGLVNAYGTYQSFYYQHLTPTTPLLSLNLVGSTECFVVLVLSNPVGRLLDAGFARHLVLCGACLVTIGTYSLSAVVGGGGRAEGDFTLIWVTQGLIQGLGMSCFFVPSSQSKCLGPLGIRLLIAYAVAATWFIKRKSTAVGIVASGASIGKQRNSVLI